VVDPGSVNIDGFVYLNPEAHIRHGLALAARYGFHPGYAIYEPGFLRLGANLAREAAAPQPIYRFMFSEGFAFGFPPAPYALRGLSAAPCGDGAGRALDDRGACRRRAATRGEAAARGGHVRVGLEDAPLGTARGNLDWVRAARREIEAADRVARGAADVRAALRGR
jgi:3-keto-5-aminohexanoate cleavage enzyme